MGQAQTVLAGIEQGLQSLLVSEAPDDASVASAEATSAAAMVQQLRSDVRNMSHGFSSAAQYQQGGNAYSRMMSKSHATQRSVHSTMGPDSLPASLPGAGAVSRAAAGMPVSARPRSAGGAAPDTPTKKTRMVRSYAAPQQAAAWDSRAPPPPRRGVWRGLSVEHAQAQMFSAEAIASSHVRFAAC